MNDLETRAAEFVRGVWHDYLEARDYSGIIRSFDEEVTWIGTGEGELCLSLGDAVRMLGAESQEWSGHFSIVGEDYRARQLSDDLFLTFGTIRAREESGGQDRVVADLNTRFSGVCRLQDGNFSVLPPAPLGPPTATSGEGGVLHQEPHRAEQRPAQEEDRGKNRRARTAQRRAQGRRDPLPLRARGHERPCV